MMSTTARGSPLISEYLDNPVVASLLDEYVTELQANIAELEQALVRADAARLAAMSHSLMGSAGLYGFPQICEAAQGLEKAAKGSAPVAKLKSCVDELVGLCRRATGGR